MSCERGREDMMNAMIRVGLGLGMTALAAVLVGCSGGGSSGAFAPKSPSYGGGETAAEVTASASQPGYAPSGGAPAADMAPSAPPPAPSASMDSRTVQREEGAARPSRRVEVDDRPGLGTQWGETRFSRISTVPFVRADPSSPFATASLFYNDEEGARAMASTAGFRRTTPGWSSQANGIVSVGLRDEHGGFLSGFVANNK